MDKVHESWAGIAQSVQRLAAGWKVRGLKPGGGEIYRQEKMEVRGQVHAPAALTPVPTERDAGCDQETSCRCGERKLCLYQESNRDPLTAQSVISPLNKLCCYDFGDIHFPPPTNAIYKVVQI